MLIDDFNNYELLNEIKFRNTLAAGALGAAALAAHNYNPTAKYTPLYTQTQQISPELQQKIDKAKEEEKEYTKLYMQALQQNTDHRDENISNTPKKDTSPKVTKIDFIKKIKPLIDKQNNKILKDRKFLLSLPYKMTKEERQHFEKICDEYGTKDYKELLVRVDIIPDNLALAQAALESGWGTSDFAQNNSSLFGQRASRDSMNFANYDSYSQSISSYMHNLNTNAAYKKFRQARRYMRTHDGELNATLLARTLTAYDATGKAYTKKVQNMVHELPKAEKLAFATPNNNEF